MKHIAIVGSGAVVGYHGLQTYWFRSGRPLALRPLEMERPFDQIEQRLVQIGN